MRLLGRYLLTLLLAAMGLVAGLFLLTRPAKSIAGAAQSQELPAAVELNELSQRSVVYDRNGGVLAVLHAEENRSPVTLEQVPDHVVNAILDVEDDDFYDHGGVNLRAILRATLANVESGEVVQGGSTITQQLVKNSLLTPERDVGRKAKEAVLAVRLENQMSKREILEQYLNTVYFGSGAYGVQAAAETYWGVEAADLTAEQGAFLAGLIRNPVGYDPFKRPDLARARRDYALDRMVIRGHLRPQQAKALKKVAIPSKPFDPLKSRDDYFLEEVKQRLLDDKRLGTTPTQRYNALFRGGLRIETTFDPRLQEIAERKIKEKIPSTKGRFTPALVSVEPSTGAVRAMVAGDGFEDAKYNLATGRGGSGRQPGSSFKTFVLLAAMENGYGPNDTVNGSEPCPVRIKGVKPNPYEPGNYEGAKGSVGPISSATAKSLNCAFIRIGLALDDNPFESLEEVADMARRMGVHIPEDRQFGPSISLGSVEATPLEMASAYGVLANDGVRHEPYFVERVLDRTGKVVLTGKDEGERVLEANIARAAVSVLRGVVDGGTGKAARQRDRVVAGKTGTSQEWRDAWFIGFTPQLSTAVWMGNPNKQDSMRNVGGIRVTGGSYPAAAWGAYTAEALQGQASLKFPEPDLRAFGKTKTVKVSKEAGGSTTTVKKKAKKKSSGTPGRTTPTTSSSPGPDDSGATTGGGSGDAPAPPSPPSG
ncbi:MAG: transglycosylase domain-containing protein [Actinobacteria bacterium]|nr:transglycosylase domain-containing protein [Actinomycetota bacterium]MBW3649477.1 transglycosylase domain-containing protein [Actinomycetota bacterium]